MCLWLQLCVYVQLQSGLPTCNCVWFGGCARVGTQVWLFWERP